MLPNGSARTPVAALAALVLLAACDGVPRPGATPAATSFTGAVARSSDGVRDDAPPSVLRIEAEHARLVGDMRKGHDERASGQRYASVPGNGSSRDMKAYAEFAFRTAAAGTYRLRGRVRGPRREANSFFVQVADGETLLWHTTRSESRYVEEYVTADKSPFEVRLPAGESLVRVFRRENSTRLDWLELVPVVAEGGDRSDPVEIAHGSAAGVGPGTGAAPVPGAANPDTAPPSPFATVTDSVVGSGDAPVPAPAPPAPAPKTPVETATGDAPAPEPAPARKVVDSVDTTRGTVGGADFWAAAGFGTAGQMSEQERARIAEIERLLEEDAQLDVNRYQCR